MTQIAPTLLRNLDAEPLGCLCDALPRFVVFNVGDALHLIEASYCVSDMTCVNQRLFPLFGEGELVVSSVHSGQQYSILPTF